MILTRLSEEKGVSLNIKYTRMQQVYAVPIHLTPDITYEGVLTGTLLPVRTSIASASLLIPLNTALGRVCYPATDHKAVPVLRGAARTQEQAGAVCKGDRPAPTRSTGASVARPLPRYLIGV